jgi:hypothetical protein
MSTVYLLCLCLAAEPPTGAVKLLLGTEEYTKADGREATLDGLLERTPTTGRAGGSARFNIFRLRFQDAEGKAAVRELHLEDKAYLVASQVGKKVRVHGKLMDIKAESAVIAELWPAWLQPLSGPLVLGVDGIYARSDWQPEEARKRGTRQFVFRSGEQLAEAMRISGSSASQTATTLLAQRLRVPAIDWEKHMLVCVSAGLQTGTVEGLAIVKVKEEGGVLRVAYRLISGKGAGIGFGYPAQTVLVNRFAGEVRFEQESPPKP